MQRLRSRSGLEVRRGV
ncbi:hypothetical protein LINGRAPRIM_LOCUS1246 [Linum grandiflorum]